MRDSLLYELEVEALATAGRLGLEERVVAVRKARRGRWHAMRARTFLEGSRREPKERAR